jgi:hypothetical protein
MLSTNPLDYLPQIDQRGLIAKRNLETPVLVTTALTVALHNSPGRQSQLQAVSD